MKKKSAKIRTIRQIRVPFLAHVCLTLALWILLIYTALNIKISYDESLSFYALKTNDWRKLIGLANTHWLNSLWMKITMLVSGDNLFAMRILSLAAFPLYATGVFRIAQTFKNQRFALAIYALLLLNPYSLQFFALARGYGLAMAIQAWLIYELLVASSEWRVASWYRIGHLCLLMMLANFSYLYTVFGVFAIFLLHIILRKKDYTWNKDTFKITLYFTLIILGTTANLMIYRHTGDLWFGGQHFIESVFTSVWLRYIYYLSTETLPQILSYLTLGIIAIITTYFAIDFFRKKEINAGVGLSIIILAMLVLTLFFHLAFDTPYLFKRTALQWWIPAFVLFFIWLKKITNPSSDISKMSDDSTSELAFSSPQPPPKGEKDLGSFSPKGKILTQDEQPSPPLEKNPASFSPPLEGAGGWTGKAFFSITASIFLLANFIFQYKNNYHARIEKQRYDEIIYNDLLELNPSKVGMSSHFTIQLQHYYQYKNPQFTTLNYAPIREKKLTDCENGTAWNDLTQFDYIIASESETIDCLREKNIEFELVKTYGKHRLVHLK